MRNLNQTNEEEKMLYKEYTKKGYISVEIRIGINGSGNTIFSVQTERKGKNGQIITWVELGFRTVSEAESWVKHIL